MSNIIQEKEIRERLLKNVKKECKQLMEIAVTKKFINEDNSCITSLCATIESCLLHGLKRRAIGLFKTSTTMSLLQKISKNCEQAKIISEMCEEYDKAYCSKNSTIDQKTLSSMNSQQSFISRKISSDNTIASNQLLNGRNFSPTYYKGSNCYRFLWIRIAILNKCLIKIIEYIISISGQFYYPYALLADPVDGPIFSSLLIGPCALEYTQMKSCEHLWNDPNADELIQRHKMHSSANLNSSSYNPISVSTSPNINPATSAYNKYKLGLNSSLAKRKASINTVFEDLSNLGLPLNTFDKLSPSQPNASNYFSSKDQSYPHMPSSPNAHQNSINYSAKEYVESIHQNSKSQLIYGKNHVVVNQREKDIPGYLSLHLNSNGLVLKWTPNQIMNGSNSFDESVISKTKTGYWDYALNIDMNTIVYLHCHQQASEGATIVLVAQDGVQHPPIIFPKGSHLLQFLTCLENGLAPNGQLDPALWNDNGKGKIFPKLPRKTMKKHRSETGVTSETENNETENTDFDDDQEDFVFRIINSKSNVSVTTVNSESPNKKKLEFSLSAGNKTESSGIVNSFFFKKIGNNQSKLSSIFSSIARKNSSLDENQVSLSESLKAPPPSMSSQNSIYNSFENHGTPISPSSIVLDKTSNNGMNILSKIDIDSMSNEFYTSEALTTFKHLSARSSLRTLCDNMRKQILSRAFYGWLAYHRHLKTVSTRLTGLINIETDRFDQDPDDDENSILEFDETSSQKINIGKNYLINRLKLDESLWTKWLEEHNNQNKLARNKSYFYRIVYLNGIESKIRKQVWPFLLEHYTVEMNKEAREQRDKETSSLYYRLIEEWKPFEEHINAKDQKKLAASLNKTQHTEKVVQEDEKTEKLESKPTLNELPISFTNKSKPATIRTSLFGFNLIKQKPKPLVTNEKSLDLEDKKERLRKDSSVSNDVFIESDSTFSFSLSKFSARSLFNKLMSRNLEDAESTSLNSATLTEEVKDEKLMEDDEYRAIALEIVNKVLNAVQNDWESLEQQNKKEIYDSNDETIKSESIYTDTKNVFSNTTSSISIDETFHDVDTGDEENIKFYDGKTGESFENDDEPEKTPVIKERQLSVFKSRSNSIRRTLSNQELIETFALNMHRIDKDVTRCDRNYWYFTSNENLKKLKNIMYTYVWENLHIGYIQGMCDLVAPLLVIFDDEPLTYNCFKQLMKRMSSNFPHGTAMDQHFSNMRTLIQILDSDLFEHMHHRGDYTHFYFSYRWFLLDFKRELVYDDVFSVWETIWSAKYLTTAHFHLFIALALVETYRDIIIENNMDFTDIIKFFNEMAEKHYTPEILELARNLIKQLQNLIDNKNDTIINDF